MSASGREFGVLVLAAGATTSVGLTMASSAAAIRAGLANFSETHFVGPGREAIIGAAVPPDAMGMPVESDGSLLGGEPRLDVMLARAVGECMRAAKSVEPRRTAMLLVAPERVRLHDPERWAQQRIRACEAALGLEFHAERQGFPEGSPGLISALAVAREWLAESRVEACLVAGADSYLNPEDMRELLRTERVLTPATQDGFIPGEAAACVLVVRSDAAVLADRTALQLLGIGRAQAPDCLAADRPARGIGLAQAARAALAEAQVAAHELGKRHADVTGEAHAFEDVGHAWARLLRQPSPDDASYETPVTRLGHVGAAIGPLLLGLALHHGESRGESHARLRLEAPGLIFLSSAGPGRGAVVIQIRRAPDGQHAAPWPLRVHDGRVLPALVAQHAEDASFYWSQCATGALRSRHTPRSLARLERLLDAHLEGLHTADVESGAGAGWEICWQRLQRWPAAEQAFVATWAALAAASVADPAAPERLERLESMVRTDVALSGGLPAAVARWPSGAPWAAHCVERWQLAPAPELRWSGLTAAVLRREDAEAAVTRGLADDDARTRARALRACGELGLATRRAALVDALSAGDVACRRWAAWSLAWLGDPRGRTLLLEWLAVTNGDSYPASAVIQVLGGEERLALVRAALREPGRARQALEVLRFSGDLCCIPDLLDAMEDRTNARLAADVFSHITGASLAAEGMWQFPPEPDPASHDDADPDISVAAKEHPDEDLPWPDIAGIQRWWAAERGRIVGAGPWLAGRPLTPTWAQALLREPERGQLQRHHAALYLHAQRLTPTLHDVTDAASWQAALRH